jgi:hypothetical protein
MFRKRLSRILKATDQKAKKKSSEVRLKRLLDAKAGTFSVVQTHASYMLLLLLLLLLMMMIHTVTYGYKTIWQIQLHFDVAQFQNTEMITYSSHVYTSCCTK